MAFQIIGRCGQATAALVAMALLTRTLGIGAVGIFATWEAIFTLLDVVVDGGSGNALVRRGGAFPQSLKPLLARALRFRTITATLATLVAFGVATLDPRVQVSDPGLVICAIGLWFHLFGSRACVFQLCLDFRFPSVLRIVTALLGLLGVILLASQGNENPLNYLAAIALARMLGNLVIWIGAAPLLRRWVKANGESNHNLGGFERESLALGLGWLAREAYGRLDILALRALAGPVAAGIYAPVRKTFTLAVQIPAFVTNVAMASLSSQAESDPEAFRNHVRRLARNLSLFVIPLAAISWPFAYLYLDLAFGAEYGARGVTALWILIGAGILVYPSSVFITAIIASGRAGLALGVSVVALVVCVIGNLIWVPGSGVTGAAIARIVTEGAALAAAIFGWSMLRQGSARLG